ncbi:MAG: TonB family protein, partial [Candidatus Binatia bacterium]
EKGEPRAAEAPPALAARSNRRIPVARRPLARAPQSPAATAVGVRQPNPSSPTAGRLPEPREETAAPGPETIREPAIVAHVPPAPAAVSDDAWLAPLLDRLRERLEAERRYPRLARRFGLEGTVTLRARIARDGSVREWDVASRSPHRILDEAALDAARAVDAVASGEGRAIPKEITVVVPMRFRLEEESDVP